MFLSEKFISINGVPFNKFTITCNLKLDEITIIALYLTNNKLYSFNYGIVSINEKINVN